MRYLIPAILLSTAAFAAGSTVTFNKDVLPIVQRNCQVCHRPGEIGPMAFLTYEGTRPWAKAIKAAVVSKKMPPWFADPKYGHFTNEKHLSDAEIATLAAWADNGAPEGDAKDKPEPVAFQDRAGIFGRMWCFQLPKPFKIPARGTLEYTYITVLGAVQRRHLGGGRRNPAHLSLGGAPCDRQRSAQGIEVDGTVAARLRAVRSRPYAQ